MDPLSKKTLSKITTTTTVGSILANTVFSSTSVFKKGLSNDQSGLMLDSSSSTELIDGGEFNLNNHHHHLHPHRSHHGQFNSTDSMDWFNQQINSSASLLNSSWLSKTQNSGDYFELETSESSELLPMIITDSSNFPNEPIYEMTDYKYELEAVPDPYQTMIETLFITTSILALFFNISALLLIVTRQRTGRGGRLIHTGTGQSFSYGHTGRSYSQHNIHQHHCHQHGSQQGPRQQNISICRKSGQTNSIISRSSLGSNNHHFNHHQINPLTDNQTTTITSNTAMMTNENGHHSSKGGDPPIRASPPAVALRSGRLNVASSSQLRLYLINLFVNDIVIALFTTPFSYTDFMYGQWIYPAFLCPITNFISTCAVAVSVYTLIAIGLERYFAIIYPFKQLSYFKHHTKWIIALIWAIGIILAIPTMIQSSAVPFQFRNQSLLDCRELWEREIGSKVYTGVLFGATFVIPFCALTFLYISIAVQAFRHVIPGNADASRDHIQLKNKIRMVKMLVLLVITFAVCWLPIQTFNMVMWLCDRCRTSFSTDFLVNVYVAVSFVCQWLSIAHSLIDPIIYCFNSKNFKISHVCGELKSIGVRLVCCRSTIRRNISLREVYHVRQNDDRPPAPPSMTPLPQPTSTTTLAKNGNDDGSSSSVPAPVSVVVVVNVASQQSSDAESHAGLKPQSRQNSVNSICDGTSENGRFKTGFTIKPNVHRQSSLPVNQSLPLLKPSLSLKLQPRPLTPPINRKERINQSEQNNI